MLLSTRTALHSRIMASRLVPLFALDSCRTTGSFGCMDETLLLRLAEPTRSEWQVKLRRVISYTEGLHLASGPILLLQGDIWLPFHHHNNWSNQPRNFISMSLCRYNSYHGTKERFLRMGAWNGTSKDASGWFCRPSDIELDWIRVEPVKSYSVFQRPQAWQM